MAHFHYHHHDPVQADASCLPDAGKSLGQSFIAGIVLNTVYVIIELVYGFTTGSASLLSDAVHNLGDISGLLLAFGAWHLLKLRPNQTFSYGYKRGTIAVSFLNALVLAVAIGAIFVEGIQKLFQPDPVNGTVVMTVAAAGVIINLISALFFKKEHHHDINVRAAYWHLMTDALVSLGVVGSGLIIRYTGWYFVDGLSAIIIAAVVFAGTWTLFKESVIGILDGVPASVNIPELKAHLAAVPGVIDIHHMHVWGLSTREIALTAHVTVGEAEAITAIKSGLKQELKEHGIAHSTLEFELDSECCREKTW